METNHGADQNEFGRRDTDGESGPGESQRNEISSTPEERPAWVGGHSVEDRPIVVEHFGRQGPILFVTSGIHGQERLAISYAERFRTRLHAGFADEMGIQVLLMQCTNPDGAAEYDRFNGNGIDLNRNFPADNYEAGGVAGDEPLSEPETRALKDVVDASNLAAALSFHGCIPTFDPDGPATELARAMSRAMDPAYRFPADSLGAAPGSMGSYLGLDARRPTITVEFAGTEQLDALIQLAQMDRAVDAAAQWTRRNGRQRSVDFGAMPDEPEWPFRCRYVATSAGGLPLRVESAGRTDAGRCVLLSGFDGSRCLGPWIAEHIRRELLAVPGLNMARWHMMTAVNPDGLRAHEATNDEGVDIVEALAKSLESGSTTHPEVAAVLEMLADKTATVFVVTSNGDATNRVAVTGANREALADEIPPRFEVGIDDDVSELVEGLVAQGHTAVSISVGTEHAEAQLQEENWVDMDPTLDDPRDFSSMVLAMARRC